MSPGDTLSIIPSVAGGARPRPMPRRRGVRRQPDRDLPQLTNDEIKRYSRHLIMPEVGMDGQRRLKAGSVLCIGAGGLGSPAAMYLAAAGVGTHRHRRLRRRRLQQPAAADHPRHAGRRPFEARVGEGSAARDQPARRRPDVRDRAVVGERAEAVRAVRRHPRRHRQLSRRAISTNDACVLLGKPNAYGSIFRFEGQASVFATKDGPCYRCLYPEPPPPGLVPSCAEGGVLGVLPGVIGVIQATEAIKLITGIGEPLIGRFLIYDALRMRFRELKLQEGSGLPGVRHASDGHQAHRLRTVLRHSPGRAGDDRCEQRQQRDRNHVGRAEAAARSRRQADASSTSGSRTSTRSTGFRARC